MTQFNVRILARGGRGGKRRDWKSPSESEKRPQALPQPTRPGPAGPAQVQTVGSNRRTLPRLHRWRDCKSPSQREKRPQALAYGPPSQALRGLLAFSRWFPTTARYRACIAGGIGNPRLNVKSARRRWRMGRRPRPCGAFSLSVGGFQPPHALPRLHRWRDWKSPSQREKRPQALAYGPPSQALRGLLTLSRWFPTTAGAAAANPSQAAGPSHFQPVVSNH